MVIFFVCIVPVRRLLSSTAVLYHENDYLQRANCLDKNQPSICSQTLISTLYDLTASRAISLADILRPSLDCYHGDEHCKLRFLLQMEKIRKDRQHSPVLVW